MKKENFVKAFKKEGQQVSICHKYLLRMKQKRKNANRSSFKVSSKQSKESKALSLGTFISDFLLKLGLLLR